MAGKREVLYRYDFDRSQAVKAVLKGKNGGGADQLTASVRLIAQNFDSVPIPPAPDPGLPPTGDSTPVALLILLIAAACIGAVILLRRR